MRRFKLIITIIILVLICAFPAYSRAKYTPSLSISSYLNLTQNKSLTNFDLPLRTSGNFELNITPLSFTFNNSFLFDVGLSLYTNSNSIVWNNTQLLGYYGLEGSFLLGSNLKSYQIKAGIGLSYNRYHGEDYYFIALNGILKQSLFINKYLAFSFPFKFSFRQEVFDYRLGFAITYYPIGGKI